MALNQFSDELYVREIDTSGVPEKMGSFINGISDVELAACRVHLYKHGIGIGSESLQVHIYSDSSYSTLIGSSSILSLSDLSGSQYFRAYAVFDFDGIKLLSGSTYYAAIEASNYTRTASFYISFVLDWPISTNNVSVSGERGADMQFFKRSERI